MVSATYTGENVTAGVTQSLRRLRTSYLDVVQVHGNPTRKELEDGGVMDALLKLQRQGAVRHLGISSRLPLLAEFVDVDCFSVIQVPYSALQRQNEDVIAALRSAGKAVVARGVTGRGAPAKGWATRPSGPLMARCRNSGSGRNSTSCSRNAADRVHDPLRNVQRRCRCRPGCHD